MSCAITLSLQCFFHLNFFSLNVWQLRVKGRKMRNRRSSSGWLTSEQLPPSLMVLPIASVVAYCEVSIARLRCREQP